MNNQHSPRIRLFCIPYAGGSAHTYKRFRKHLHPHIEIVPLDPPGHGGRMEEPLISSYPGMAHELARDLELALARKKASYALFGHSMGASLAYLIIREFQETGFRLPVHLFVSGSASPEVSPRFRGLYKLQDEAFIQAMSRLGGMPGSVESDRSILELFLPVLRSDFKAASAFHWSPPKSRLAVPITAFYGDDDVITGEMPAQWQSATSIGVEVHRFPGGHFFFMNHIGEIAHIVNNSLEPLNILSD